MTMNLERPNREIPRRLSVVAAISALSFSGTLSLHGREDSGEIITGLVERVEGKLANLENSISDTTGAQDELRDRLIELKDQYEKEVDVEERLHLKSELVAGLTQLNTNDRRLIQETMSTILSVESDLLQLEEVFIEGVMGVDSLERQRSQVRNVIMGVGPLLGVLTETLEDPMARRQAETTEQTLVLLYQQLEATADVDSESMLGQIRSTGLALQEVAAQLSIVENLLEMERFQLEVVAKVSIAELLMARIGQVRFGGQNLVSVPKSFQEGVAERSLSFGRILRTSSLAPVGAAKSRTDEAILAKIRRGEVPH